MSSRSIITAAAIAAFGMALTSTVASAQMATPAPQIGPSDRAAIQAAFARVDVNGDGKLSKVEVARLPAIAVKFADLDKDKDGFLNLDEFAVGYNAPA